MDFEAWMQFFGTSQDDPNLKAALAAAGVKKVPKLDEEEMSVQFELKGQGLELIMTDEAILKKIKNQDVGEGPLIMSGVLGKVGKRYGRDVYTGKLPLGLAADMSQDAVRKILGKPTTTDTEPDIDIWSGKKGKVSVSYAIGCASITAISVKLPYVEF